MEYPPPLLALTHLGSRYWLRRRKPARERGINMRSSLGLPGAYNDIFDRIESGGHAWTVASGHLLLHALDPPPHTAAGYSASCRDGTSGGGGRRRAERRQEGDGGGDGEESDVGDGDLHDERYRRLLDNCLQPPWYKVAAEKRSSTTTVIAEAGNKFIPSLTVALTQLTATAKGVLSPKSSPTRSANTISAATKAARELAVSAVTAAFAAAQTQQQQKQPDESSSSLVTETTLRTPQKSRARSRPTSSGVSRREHSRSHREHSCSRTGRSRGSRGRTPTPLATTTSAAAAEAVPTSAPAADAKTCAICLQKLSPVAMCRECGRRAAKALKDAQGSRQARIILVPFGAVFGVSEPDALQAEGDAVKRWVRLFDDETGGNFYHNVHYDFSVWESGIELPEVLPEVKRVRRRKGGGVDGGGMVGVASPRSNSAAATSGKSTPRPGSPAAIPLSSPQEGGTGSPSKTTFRVAALAAAAAVSSAAASSSTTGRTALKKANRTFSAMSMAALQAAGGSGSINIQNDSGGGAASIGGGATCRPVIQPAIRNTASPLPLSPPKTEGAAASPGGHRVVISEGATGGGGGPQVILDAQKRIYPSFRLISWEDAEAACSGGVQGVTPGRGFGFPRKITDSAGGGGCSTWGVGG